MISEEYSAIFVHVPKCAGTSVKSLLSKKTFKGVSLNNAKDGSHDDKTGYYQAGTARRMKRAYEEQWKTYFKFAFSRNPWDRMVSCWKNRAAQKYSNFKDFVYNHQEMIDSGNTSFHWHVMPQCLHVCNDEGDIIVDYIGRFENLQEDINNILELLDLEPSEVPHKNKTSHKNYREYYNKETIRRVEDLFWKDIEMFEYEY